MLHVCMNVCQVHMLSGVLTVSSTTHLQEKFIFHKLILIHRGNIWFGPPHFEGQPLNFQLDNFHSFDPQLNHIATMARCISCHALCQTRSARTQRSLHLLTFITLVQLWDQQNLSGLTLCLSEPTVTNLRQRGTASRL